MAIEIIRESAQDEVCCEIWDVLQAIKKRVEVILSDDSYDPDGVIELSHLTGLMSRVGNDYRYHAEKAPSSWTQDAATVRDAETNEVRNYTRKQSLWTLTMNVNATDTAPIVEINDTDEETYR